MEYLPRVVQALAGDDYTCMRISLTGRCAVQTSSPSSSGAVYLPAYQMKISFQTG